MRARRPSRVFSGASGLAALLLIAGCGASADDAVPSVGGTEPAVSATTPVSVGTNTSDDQAVTDESTDPAMTNPGDDGVAATAPADSTPTDPTPTDPTNPAPAPPAVGGRALAAELAPASAFDANPLPDLVVDDIGRDAKANVANLFPASLPVLVWAWAPH